MDTITVPDPDRPSTEEGDDSFGAPEPVATDPLCLQSRRTSTVQQPAGESGSIVTEYGLLVVVAATICGVVINWASNGQIVTLFNALMRQARALVGA